MPRGFSNYSVPLIHASGWQHMFSWMSARLFELAWTEPGCEAVSVAGPQWVYHRNGKEATTRPGLTLQFMDGRVAYWSALERTKQGELPGWVEVQRVRAQLQGADFWLLTDDFLHSNGVEYRNRTNAYYMLAHAREWCSEEVERDVLMATHPAGRRLGELAKDLKRPMSHVHAAVLRLWRLKRVDLPMATEPMGENWLVKGAPHGLS